MQRVVRNTLVGLLAIGGLTACGDKVTVPQQTTQAPDNTVKQVTVSPASATLNVGDKITLAASVNAGAGVTNRTVTWSSSNAAIASVDANGVVTAVAAGNATIIAKSAADPSVQGAAAITVNGGSQNAPIVTVSTINQTVCGIGGCNSVPANLAAAAGQLDVTLNVEPNGATLKTITAILKCGNEQQVRTQTIALQAASAEASTAPVTFSFNTAEFNGTTGVPTLHNGACTISASALTTAGTQSAVNTTPLTLANPDVVVVRTTAQKSASDANGLPWKGGDITVAATPVLYSGRTPATINITLPGAVSGATQTLTATAGTTSATWSGTATTGPRTTQATIIGGVDANGFAVGVHPTVLVIDSNGNDLALPQANSLTESDVRVDNQSPAVPTVFQIPTPVSATNATGMNGWVNAAYTFTGTAAKYVSGGDAGVSSGAVSGTSGLNGNTVITYWAAPVASYTNVGGAAAPATGVTAAACATTGLTQITTAGDLAATLVNSSYRVRVNEADKLGNVRCTDLGALGGSAPVGTFGVDKVAPVDTFATASAKDQAIVNIANPAVTQFQLAISDDASGFTATPALTTVIRNFPSITSAAACVVGNFSNGTCNTASTGTTINVDGGSALEGYYTYTSTVRDQAQNAGQTVTRMALVDKTAPVMGGVSVPASIAGGSSASFSTSATDNLDLATSNYTLHYGSNIANPPAASATLDLRANGPALGTAFDNVLTTTASFTVTVPTFLRNVQVTNGADAPVAYNAGNLPTSLDVRAVDAAGNASAAGTAAIGAANVPQTGAKDYSTVGITTWSVTNAAGTNVCNSTTTCGATTSATSVTLTAAASGALSTFQVPFNAVQFYYFDTASNQWVAIGSPVVASTVTDNAGTATRTFTWSNTFDPPASLGTGVALNVIAVGYNTTGDALASRANGNITLTP